MNGNPLYEFAGMIHRRLTSHVHPDAVTAVQRIANEVDAAWARGTAATLANKLREQEWQPATISDIDQILADPSKRLVTSEAQLAQVVLDAIDEVADQISRDRDVAAQFWDKQATKPPSWRPVPETLFTTRFMERVQAKLDTVVLRQEGQLHLGSADTAGSEPDFEAIHPTPGLTLSVLGEVKGIWHGDYETAIETQLADRYLTSTRTSTGIYLVAHFASDRWDPDDYRYPIAVKRDRGTLTATLQAEALRLSVEGKMVHARVIALDL